MANEFLSPVEIGREVRLTTASSAEVENECTRTSTDPYNFRT